MSKYLLSRALWGFDEQRQRPQISKCCPSVSARYDPWVKVLDEAWEHDSGYSILSVAMITEPVLHNGNKSYCCSEDPGACWSPLSPWWGYQDTTKILETPMSTFRNKCRVRRIVQSSRRFGLERTRLTVASVAICFNSAHTTYFETICVH